MKGHFHRVLWELIGQLKRLIVMIARYNMRVRAETDIDTA
jgi:hypothetical protein